MATTTPNYGWDVPTSTDYVKDGATAIETLGDDIDTSLYAALSGKPAMAVLLNTSTGTASSAQITGVFNSSYTTYYIEYVASAPGTAAWAGVQMVSGSTPVTSGYHYQRRFDYSNGPGSYEFSTSASDISIVYQATGGPSAGGFYLSNPFLTTRSLLRGHAVMDQSTSSMSDWVTGMLPNNTSYDGIKFNWAASLTYTIRIYGLRNS